MLGFRNTYSCPHRDDSYVYNSSFECLMRENRRNEFCDVCTLQGTKRMSQLISDPPALYAAVPEVKLYTGNYKNPTENPEAYRDPKYSGYWRYQQDRESRLLSGKDNFSPAMKGQEIELRTIVQNLSDTEEQTVTLRLWVQHADGSRAVTADGGDVWAEKVFTVPVWSEKSKFWPKGALEYTGSDFDSGLVNALLSTEFRRTPSCKAAIPSALRWWTERGIPLPPTAPKISPTPTLPFNMNWRTARRCPTPRPPFCRSRQAQA